jgi:hypothetical protein
MKYQTKDVTQPFGGATVYVNTFWLCVDGDLTKALFYKNNYPQCNRNKNMMDWALKNAKDLPENTSAVFATVSYVLKNKK